MKVLIRKAKTEGWEFAEQVTTQAEVELQKLLIESPSLIPVDEIREGVSPLVVAVDEVGLPGSGQTDAIAFTADGDIALIECKLAANAEIKRKVIGQILEYAAFLWEMDYEELDSRVMARRGKHITNLVESAVAGEWDESSFREGIIQSLQSGSFLLIILVDEINDELRRIVRYLNECGKADFSFHALELTHYKTKGLELLVPHLHGASVIKSNNRSKRKRWTELEFISDLAKNLAPQEAFLAEKVFHWGQDTADRMLFGTGTATGSVSYHFLPHGKTASVFTIFTSGKFVLNYGFMIDKFDESIINAFHQRITAIKSLNQIPADFSKWPSMDISKAFPNEASLNEFKLAVEWLRGLLYKDE